MCQLGLELKDNNCVTIKEPKNCIKKNSQGNCDLCGNNLYVDEEGNCTKKCTIKNCSICEFEYNLNKERCYLCNNEFVAHLESNSEKQEY